MPYSRAGRRSLRVAMPMLTLVPGGMGGSETYARELTRHLVRQPGLEVTTMVSAGAAGFSRGLPEYVERRLAGGESTLKRVRTQVHAATSRTLRSAVDRSDLVHYPLSVPVPRPPHGVPYVQTLLDVQHHDLPEVFSRPELMYRRVLYDRPARRADGVVTISEFSKRQIVSHLGIDPTRVHVAHLGVDATQFVPYDGPRDDFVLYPARGWPHKNHARLVEAMHLVRQREPGLRLVLTGGGLDTLGGLPAWVERRGLVSRADLLELYRRAACLVFPSRYEGFGLPPLEAMASGCPVAAATAGSLPEIVGDAAVSFDPDDTGAMASAILTARSSRERLASVGHARCKLFTWERCAATHAEVYRGVALGRDGS